MNEVILNDGEQIEDLQNNGLMLIQNKDKYCFSSDATMLSDVIVSKRLDKVVEFCAGSGVISILLTQKIAASNYYLFEIQEDMAELCQKNIELNELSRKLQVYNKNLNECTNELGFEVANIVVCNPPYMKNNNINIKNSLNKAISRTEIQTNFDEICFNASKILKYNGDFYFSHLISRLPEIIVTLKKYKLEPKILYVIIEPNNKEASIFIMKATKGGKEGLKLKNIIRK